MISPQRLLRRFAPTAALSWSTFVACLGVTALVLGVVMSFRSALLPVRQEAARVWEQWVSGAFGTSNVSQVNHFVGGLLLFLGFVLTYAGVQGIFRSFMRAVNPNVGENVASLYFRQVQLARGPKIVAMGGGTGLSTLLRGLKRHSSNITAIVTVTDDGGSSGRLSQELGIIPPGDLRNCLVALADADKQLSDVFQYRFRGQSGSLSGHSLGNLLIAGFVDLSGGDFEKALRMASEVLNIRGRVMPSTLERVRLRALLGDGSEICGETAIVESAGQIRRMFIDPDDAHAYPDAIRAIEEAEVIVIGPGSVYTSVLPNLLVPGIAEALQKSKAKKFYICNVMTQPGESDSFTACEHVLVLEANTGARLFDHVLVNTQTPSHDMLERYNARGQFMVEADVDRIRTMNFRVIGGDFMSETDYVRHDPMRLADAIIQQANR